MDLPQKEKLFQKYYDKLIWETIHARAHLKLWERLEHYRASYLKELNQAPHFFTFTLKAHLDDTLVTLSRILDRRRCGDPLSIWKFLDFVHQNLEIFSNEAFSQRMKQKPDYEKYSKYQDESHTPITQKEIEEDKQKLLSLEHTIDNLTTWRDKVIAHIDRRFLLRGRIVSQEYPLQRQKLEEIIQALVKILNRYSGAYNSSIYAERFLGENDVQNVMNSIHFHIQGKKRQLEALKKQASDN